jgi:hypothetical protein
VGVRRSCVWGGVECGSGVGGGLGGGGGERKERQQQERHDLNRV